MLQCFVPMVLSVFKIAAIQYSGSILSIRKGNEIWREIKVFAMAKQICECLNIIRCNETQTI